MTPNPNPSPELIAAVEKLTRPIIGMENRTPLEVRDILFDRIRSHFAALSPQALPAPGEVELREAIGRELIGWDNQMSPEAIAHPNNSAFFAHWLDVTDPKDGEQARHYQAGIDMILRLATVSAANDEGVARKAEHARIVEKAKQALRLTQGCMECNADDERRWMDTIRWLEEQA